MQIGEAVGIEPFLHPGDALVVDVDQTNQMRDFGAGRITRLFSRRKPMPGMPRR